MVTTKTLRERKFQAAVSIVQNLPKSGPISTPLSTMLQFYALYKQATEGPNETPKPAFYDIVRKTKWDAWTKLGSMSKEEAMQRYIDDFVAIVDTTTHGSNVEDMIKSLGTLYEAVNDDDIDLLLGPTIDRLLKKSGCQKLAQMKDKIFKSDEKSKSSDNLDGGSDKINVSSDKELSSMIPLDQRFETRQSQYYISAPSQVEETQDAYQLKNEESGDRRSGDGTLTTWSQCVQRPDPSVQNSTNKVSSVNQQPSTQTRLVQSEPADPLHELSIVSESVISIEQELTHVAAKLNSISKLYKSQCGTSISIPTLSLILVWPVLTQFVFMWYSSRMRNVHQSSR